MEMEQAIRYLHRHYVAWLELGQWQPERAMPEEIYPTRGEWVRLEWCFQTAVPPQRWQAVEDRIIRCFADVCEVWCVCGSEKVSALAMAKTFTSPEKTACLWIAATRAAEELSQPGQREAECFISGICGGYDELPAAAFSSLNAWWMAHCPLTPQERREHRKKIQNYMKKGQFGHIGGYVARCLKRDAGLRNGFWYWVPLLMESLWMGSQPSMGTLLAHLDLNLLRAEGAEACVGWIRQTCADLRQQIGHDDPILRVTESIRKDCSLPYSQSNLAEGLGLTPTYFSKLFRGQTGVGFTDFLTRVRITRAQEMLRGDVALSEIARACGFQRKNYFCEVFRKQTGLTAMQYRARVRRGDGQ